MLRSSGISSILWAIIVFHKSAHRLVNTLIWYKWENVNWLQVYVEDETEEQMQIGLVWFDLRCVQRLEFFPFRWTGPNELTPVCVHADCVTQMVVPCQNMLIRYYIGSYFVDMLTSPSTISEGTVEIEDGPGTEIKVLWHELLNVLPFSLGHLFFKNVY